MHSDVSPTPSTHVYHHHHLFTVRTAKFVARKQWVVTGADDFFVRVYNYNTMDKIKSFEAHSDYIRCVDEGVFTCPIHGNTAAAQKHTQQQQ